MMQAYFEIGFIFAILYQAIILLMSFDKKLGRFYLRVMGYSDRAIEKRINHQVKAMNDNVNQKTPFTLFAIAIFGFILTTMLWPIAIILELQAYKQHEEK